MLINVNLYFRKFIRHSANRGRKLTSGYRKIIFRVKPQINYCRVSIYKNTDRNLHSDECEICFALEHYACVKEVSTGFREYLQDRQCTYKCNIVGRSRNHCCCEKSNKYYKYLSVCL
jgi:hypothetical protein